jgi:predicted dehydrogenase
MSFESVSISAAAIAEAGGQAATLAAPRATTTPAVVRIGLVGCGGFARFAVRQYRGLPDVSIEAVADIDATAAQRAAAELDATVLPPDEVLEHPDLDLVYIATPPALHFGQAAAALASGRHVLVEKPLATTTADAEALEALAARRGLVCVANLLERYCPLAGTIRRLIESRLLGGLVHGVFLNEAGDEGLGPEHWFWDRDIGGGIFVEHGVHFFDLVASWLGAGHVVSAARGVRWPPGADVFEAAGGGTGGEPFEEQVVCTCRYPANHALALPGEPRHAHSGVLFHFEHGFHQPALLDRQEMRLVFERGEVRLFDWVPTHGTLRALVDDEAAAALAAMLPEPIVRASERLTGGPRPVRGRFRPWEAAALVEIGFASGGDKMAVYAEAVRDLAADQIARIRDPAHVRRLTEADCVAAVALACEADRVALAAG